MNEITSTGNSLSLQGIINALHARAQVCAEEGLDYRYDTYMEFARWLSECNSDEELLSLATTDVFIDRGSK